MDGRVFGDGDEVGLRAGSYQDRSGSRGQSLPTTSYLVSYRQIVVGAGNSSSFVRVVRHGKVDAARQLRSCAGRRSAD